MPSVVELAGNTRGESWPFDGAVVRPCKLGTHCSTLLTPSNFEAIETDAVINRRCIGLSAACFRNSQVGGLRDQYDLEWTTDWERYRRC